MYKNLFTLFAALMLLTSVSCTTSKREYFTAKDYDRILQEEFQSIRDTAPKVTLYESMAVMDTMVNGEARLSEFINVFREGEHFTFSYHFPDTTIVTNFEDGKNDFMGIAPDTIRYGLDHALRSLKPATEGGCHISFYSLIGEEHTYPPYFTIDTEHGVFYVDATNGEVEVAESMD